MSILEYFRILRALKIEFSSVTLAQDNGIVISVLLKLRNKESFTF